MFGVKKAVLFLWNDAKDILFHLVMNTIAFSGLIPKPLRWSIMKACGMNIRSVRLSAHCYIAGNRLTIGKGTFVNAKCYFDCKEDVIIGNNCQIAMGVMFCTSTHVIGSARKRGSDKTYRYPIKVGNGCWIGARALIMPGVTIGEGCVIAAGAVVTRDCEPNGLYAGVPAKRIKELEASAEG